MKIGQIAPVHESVPPQGYGGIERVVSYLTEELVRLGHDVTLFATGDSKTRATLVPIADHCTRLHAQPSSAIDSLPLEVAMLEEALHFAKDLDLLHFHIDWVHFPVVRRQSIPHVTTLHNRIDGDELEPLFREFTDIPLVSISNAQRQFAPWLDYVGTVYHGLPTTIYRFHQYPDNKLAFLGRICPEKGVEDAIAISRQTGIPLRIAAKIDDDERDYFSTKVQPHIDSGEVEYVGEVSDAQKSDFLGNCRALLFPIQWPEPFGLVMIEALACGTPVVAYRRGSVPEVIEDELTGIICDDVPSAVERIRKHLDQLDRNVCRRRFEERFSVTRMTEDYLEIYEQLVQANKKS